MSREILFNLNDLSKNSDPNKEKVLFNVNDLLANQEQEKEKIYVEELDQVIESPKGLDEVELEYKVNTDLKKIPIEHHIAATPVNEDSGIFDTILDNVKKAKFLAKGFQSAVVSTPGKIHASFLLQTSEDRNKKIREYFVNKGQLTPEEGLNMFPIKTRPERARNAVRILQKQQMRMQKAGLLPPENDKVGKFLFDVGGGAPNLLTGIGLTALTRNPAHAAIFFGAVQETDIYLEARGSGLSHDKAMQVAIPAAIAEAGLEFVGLDRLFKIAKGDKFIKAAVKRALVEGTQEASQQFAEEVITDIGNVRDISLQEKIENSLYAASIGFTLGGSTSVIVSSLQPRFEGTGITEKQLTKAVNNVKNSGVPERMEKLLDKESDNSLDDGKTESAIVKNLKESAKEIKPDNRISVDNFSEEQQQLFINNNLVDENNNISSEAAVNILVQEQNKRTNIKNIENDFESKSSNNLIIEGRINQLDSEIEQIDNKISSLANQIQERKELNKPVVRLNNKLNKLLSAREGFDIERSDLLATIPEPQKAVIRNETLKSDIKLKGKDIKQQKDKFLKQKNREVNSGFRKARKIAIKNIEESQDFLTNVINKSGLTANDKSKFISTIKNIKDAKQLQRQLPEIQSRISNLQNVQARRNLKNEIKKELKKVKAKKQSGKPTGKFDNEVQEVLENLRNISRLSVTDAKSQLELTLKRFEESGDNNIPDPLETLKIRMLNIISDFSNANIAESQELLNEIIQLKETGRTNRKNSDLAKKQKINEISEGIDLLITDGKDFDLIDETTVADKFNKFTQNIRNLHALLNYPWKDIVDIILPKDNTGKGIKEKILGELDVFDLVQQEKGTARRWNQQLIDSAKSTFGISNERMLEKKFGEDNKKIDLGVFKNARNENIRVQYTVAEARKFWMELQDVTLKDTIYGDKGMAYTQNIVDSVLSILSKEDIDFARSQLNLYQKIYPEINKIYSRVYGVNLPQIDNYSPIARNHEKEFKTGEFLQESFFRLSAASGSLKSRVDNLGELQKRSDLSVFHKHVVEMAHFVTFQEKIQTLNGVFGNKHIRNIIEKSSGKTMLDLIDRTLESFITGGARKQNQLDKIVNMINGQFAISVLGGKIALAAKQFTSIPAYMENIPAKDFFAGLQDFIKNPKHAIKILKKSELVKQRGVPESDIAAIAKSSELKGLRAVKTIKEWLLIPVKLGDQGTIFMGGWAVYKYHRNQGKSHGFAIREFERATARTQQSADIDQLSDFQKGSALARTFTMFLSAPNAYYRAELRAIRQFRRGEITNKEFGKKIFIYHFLIPQFFQFVANGFRWDEEEQLIASLTGSLNGFLIVGELITNAVKVSVGKPVFDKELQFLTAIKEISEGIGEAAPFTNYDDLLEGLQDVAKGAGKLTGVPVDQITNISEGIEDIERGKNFRGTLRFLGWPGGAVQEIRN